MPRFAANLSMMYTELPFMDRFAAAATDGFTAVEYLFPYAYPAADLAAKLQQNGLAQVVFNAPPGGGHDRTAIAAAWDGGQRGNACLSHEQKNFRNGLLLALDYAHAVGCPRIHVMAGLVPAGVAPSLLQTTYAGNLHWAAGQAAAAGVDVLIEPINLRDMPGYFLNRQAAAHAIVQEIGAANLKVQLDLYHCQIVEGDLATQISQSLPTGRVGHLQVAGVPSRNEPDVGEVNFSYLFDLIDSLKFDGWIGCEYRPKNGTTEGLKWMKPGWLCR